MFLERSQRCLNILVMIQYSNVSKFASRLTAGVADNIKVNHNNAANDSRCVS